jgi:hypothetical protein
MTDETSVNEKLVDLFDIKKRMTYVSCGKRMPDLGYDNLLTEYTFGKGEIIEFKPYTAYCDAAKSLNEITLINDHIARDRGYEVFSRCGLSNNDENTQFWSQLMFKYIGTSERELSRFDHVCFASAIVRYAETFRDETVAKYN